nr:MAG TPA: Protein of unknown function (DUF1378) [Caudoviricetes sp.]
MPYFATLKCFDSVQKSEQNSHEIEKKLRKNFLTVRNFQNYLIRGGYTLIRIFFYKNF